MVSPIVRKDTPRRDRPGACTPAPMPPRAAASQTSGASLRSNILLLSMFLIAVLAAYAPAWHGGVLWDDDGHLTRPELRSLAGLGRIWFDLGATQQFYPVVHSAFWLQSWLWGESTLGYHLVNIGLHATSAFLVVLILRRLEIAGAVLAGVLFALHPVHVESVAWMTELKNTLSGVWYLAAAWVYLRFDDARDRRSYGLAVLLFLLALGSKTVTATLPAGLLVVLWWKRGGLQWTRDVVPLLPFFALGAVAGLTTAWVERTFIGAGDMGYTLAPIDRVLVAGRAVVFYLQKLAWPSPLIFFYPRWPVSAGVWWQYLFPVGVAGTLTVLWMLRRRTRAPFAALLFFVVTAAPALGFVDVYPFKFSFVADHFQYLASLGPLTLAAAGATLGSARLLSRTREAGIWRARMGTAAVSTVMWVLAPLVALPLGIVTHAQSRQYTDEETLYRTTLARNPDAWLAHMNLGLIEWRASGRRSSEAVAHFERAVALKPDEAQARHNLGVTWYELGRLEDALREEQAAIRLAPAYAEAHQNLGVILRALGRRADAAAAFRRAAELKPDAVAPIYNLGGLLLELGQPASAAPLLEEVLRREPSHVEARGLLADALARLGRTDAAIRTAETATAMGLHPARAAESRGDALVVEGRYAEAAAEFERALRLDPASMDAHLGLGATLWRVGRHAESAEALRWVIARAPHEGQAYANLGNALQGLDRLDEALAAYRRALELTPGAGRAEIHNDLGVALARMGRMPEATAAFTEAIRLKPDYPAARANLARAQGRREDGRDGGDGGRILN